MSGDRKKVRSASVPTVRTGKIARLPAAVREKVNQRLFNNEYATTILQWLNSSPEVIAILDKHFGGVPVSGNNLSTWRRRGGYQEWLDSPSHLLTQALLCLAAKSLFQSAPPAPSRKRT